MTTLLARLGAFGWLWFALYGIGCIIAMRWAGGIDSGYLIDWNVYYAGALDWLDGSLYGVPLELPGLRMSTPAFNQPPVVAWLALPLLPLGYEAGGIVWQVIWVGSVMVLAAIASRWIGWASAGLALIAYTLTPFFLGDLHVANLNALMCAGLAGFVWAHLTGRQRLAGALLGATVALKLWPLVLAVLLVRERRWLELAWASGVVAAVAAVTLAWLGPDVTPALVNALRTWLPVEHSNYVMWTSWLREAWGWPAWIGPALAVALLALPLRGSLGLATGVLAGLSLVANVWTHYIIFFALALSLMLSARSRPALPTPVVRYRASSGG